MHQKIKLAEIVIDIQTKFDSLVHIEDYKTDEEPFFNIRITDEDIIAEQRKCIEEALYEGIPCPNFSPAELENTAIYRKIAQRLPEYNACVFHGSVVAVGEKAYLFTAKSGTGKTTHTNLWLENIPGAYIVNGDKPILRLIDGKPFVCGTPWMGKEGQGCPKNIPLAGICFLKRAEENRIERTEFKKVYPRLLGQAYRPEDGSHLAKTVKILENIGTQIPIYELFCNMEKEAAKVSFEGMNGK